MATVSKDFLVKKAGPIPVWGWGALGLGAAWLYSKHQASTAAAASSTTSTTDSSAEPATGASPYWVIENNIPGGGPNTTTTATSPAGTGTTPPSTGTTTPTSPPKTITGGSPPTPPTHPSSPVGLPVSSPPSKPTTPAAPAAQKYTVQRGDTLWGIATKFTGSGANDAKIWAYNTPAARKAAGLPPVQGSNMNLIYPGEVFLIPPK